MSMKGTVERQVVPRARPKSGGGVSLTQQHFKDQVNINSIIAKYNKTGMFTHVSSKRPFFGDVSEISDYRTSLETVMKAQNLFDAMSAEVRSRFGNDPEKMIEFLLDEKNTEEAIKLGLAVERPKDQPGKVILVDESGKPVGLPKSDKGPKDPVE